MAAGKCDVLNGAERREQQNDSSLEDRVVALDGEVGDDVIDVPKVAALDVRQLYATVPVCGHTD